MFVYLNELYIYLQQPMNGLKQIAIINICSICIYIQDFEELKHDQDAKSGCIKEFMASVSKLN